ncbi:replication-relaxation family protein [Cohnella sp. GCM10020058]|uniref:replication-relaxation family protein n=1 Tax=Cohnella sp. GCM10020058 TaxID=3317330 RepID=UPI003643FE0F
MLNDWMQNESLDRISQVLNVIYDLRMVTKSQLMAITGLHEHNLNDLIKRIRKLPSDEPTDWLTTAQIRLNRKINVVYALGKRAIQHVQLQRKQEVRLREAPGAQMFHFVGINSILTRAIGVFGRNSVAWYTEGEQADILYLMLKEIEHAEPDRRSIIRPDARLRIENKDWFIEFDNATEGPRQLEIKFHRYVELYRRLGNMRNTPILWVTTTAKRRDYLQKNWEATLNVSYEHQKDLPSSLFMVEGEDTEYIRKVFEPSRSIPTLHE